MLGNTDFCENTGSAQEAFDVLRSNPLLGELITALKPHARGLRKWSVMRAMRNNRRRISRDIPLKFEDEVERIFRQFSTSDESPFYRPKDKAGEVWALNQERAVALFGVNL